MRPFAHRGIRVVIVLSALLALGYGGLRMLVRWQYPYGPSHCCLKQIGLALHVYAETHGSWYPVGGETSEASLGLLYDNGHTDANTLRGKTVPLADVEERLNAGLPLTPDTCGWNYVPGLKSTDDSQLVVVWDKIGLGHNGERLPAGGHSVLYVDGSESVISEAAWPAFLEDQKNRMDAINQRRIEEAAAKDKNQNRGFRLIDFIWPQTK